MSISSYTDEWKNFLARIGRDETTSEVELDDNPNHILELRFWASYRGQTLARTGESSAVLYCICFNLFSLDFSSD